MAVAALKHEWWDDSAERYRASRLNVGQVERLLSMVAGGALAAYAARQRGLAGGAAAVGSAALLYRGATGHCPAYDALGVNTAEQTSGSRGTGVIANRGSDTRRQLGGARGVRVEEAITIDRPVGEVFRFWRNFENLPQFMDHLDSVAMREEGVSHWVAKGPAGVNVEWDARIINEVENKILGWQSLSGSTVASAGSVNFEETDRGTRVRVHLQYSPPGGRAGAMFARLFGKAPSQTVHQDLRRLKQLLETGEIPTIDGQPSGRRKFGGRR